MDIQEIKVKDLVIGYIHDMNTITDDWIFEEDRTCAALIFNNSGEFGLITAFSHSKIIEKELGLLEDLNDEELLCYEEGKISVIDLLCSSEQYYSFSMGAILSKEQYADIIDLDCRYANYDYIYINLCSQFLSENDSLTAIKENTNVFAVLNK